MTLHYRLRPALVIRTELSQWEVLQEIKAGNVMLIPPGANIEPDMRSDEEILLDMDMRQESS